MRPRYDADKNGWWMCDIGRFAFERYNDPERLVGTLARSGDGLAPVPFEEGLDRVADALRTQDKPLVVVSPFVTIEEGERIKAFIKSIDADYRLVAPEDNGEADDVLHTGEPCPNRIGLKRLRLGREAGPEKTLAAVAEASFVLLVGERVVELLGGAEVLAGLAPGTRLVTIDTHALDVPAASVCFGTPFSIEKRGTWLNVDGNKGALRPVRPHPSGVRPVEGLLDELATRLAGEEVAS